MRVRNVPTRPRLPLDSAAAPLPAPAAEVGATDHGGRRLNPDDLDPEAPDPDDLDPDGFDSDGFDSDVGALLESPGSSLACSAPSGSTVWPLFGSDEASEAPPPSGLSAVLAIQTTVLATIRREG